MVSSKSLINGEERESQDAEGVEWEYETLDIEHRESTDEIERNPKCGGVYDIDSEGEDKESTLLGIGVVPSFSNLPSNLLSNLPSSFSAVAIIKCGLEGEIG